MTPAEWTASCREELQAAFELAVSATEMLEQLPQREGLLNAPEISEIDAAFKELRNAVDLIDARLFRLSAPPSISRRLGA